MYKNGMKSKFVHLISATKDFPLKQNVPQYKVDMMLKINHYFYQ